MTDEQIIKALESCDTREWCNDCPLKDNDHCKDVLSNQSVNLINRQKAEIDELKSDLRLKTNDYNYLKAECEKIQKVSSDRTDRLINTVVNLKNARSEAIKEFAERLKKKTYPFPCAIGVENAVSIRTIDDLVKEMVGDKND